MRRCGSFHRGQGPQPTRAEGDTAERAIAIDSGLGSERLELHVTRLRPRPLPTPRPPGSAGDHLHRLRPRHLVRERRAARARAPHRRLRGRRRVLRGREPRARHAAARLATAPNENGAPPAGRRTVRYEDQPSLPASGDREFRYLVTDEVGCTDLTQFFGVIAPGRAPDHSHVLRRGDLRARGVGTLHIDGEHEPVAAGTCIHLPPLREHSLENGGDTPMKVVAVFHPAGDPASRAYEANE